MAGESQFTIGARASATDGPCGEVSRLIIDPATDTVTHLAIQPGHRQEAARLVPVHLAEVTEEGIRLRCTLAEFGKFDHAEERDLVTGADRPGTRALWPDPSRRSGSVGADDDLRRRYSGGEDEVGPGDRVHAVDGEIGRVQGFLVNPDDDRVSHVLLQEGHVWGRNRCNAFERCWF